MASTTNRTKATTLSLTEKLIEGIQKHLAATTQVPLLGTPYTVADLTTKLEQIGTLQDAVNAARAAVKGKQSDQNAAMPALRALRSAVVGYLKSAYGGQPAVLADFGIVLKPRAPLTVQAKAAAAAKRKATRAARGTKGPKQTKAVKGDVVGVNVTPIVAPPAVAPSAPVGTTVGTGTPTAAPAATANPAPSASPAAAPAPGPVGAPAAPQPRPGA